jgi:predicted aconitase with swiveling domain
MIVLRAAAVLVQGHLSRSKTYSNDEKKRPNVHPTLHSTVPLSFWGGVDPLSGEIIDHTHPLYGRNVANTVVAIPSGRGSCTGSQVMLELILNGVAPSIILTREVDPILCVAVIVAQELFTSADEEDRNFLIPSIYCLQDDGFQKLGDELVLLGNTSSKDSLLSSSSSGFCKILKQPSSDEGESSLAYLAFGKTEEQLCSSIEIPKGELENESSSDEPNLVLTPEEQAILDGTHSDQKYHSKAHQVAMRTIVKMAKILQAKQLIPISQAHIDACTYIGKGGLKFVNKLVSLGKGDILHFFLPIPSFYLSFGCSCFHVFHNFTRRESNCTYVVKFYFSG